MLWDVVNKKVPRGDFSKDCQVQNYFLAKASFTSSAGTISSLKV